MTRDIQVYEVFKAKELESQIDFIVYKLHKFIDSKIPIAKGKK